MIIFSESGDTPASIAARILGYNDADYAKKIRDANSNGYAWQMANGAGYYVPWRPLWIPGFSKYDHDFLAREQFCRRIDGIPTYQRRKLTQAQKQCVNLNYTIAHAKVTKQYNSTKSNEEPFLTAGLVGKSVSESIGRGVERYKGQAEKFIESMNDLDRATENYYLASIKDNPDKLSIAELQLKQARNDALDEVAKKAKLIARKTLKKTSWLTGSTEKMQRFATDHGIFINDLEDIRILDKIAGSLKWMGRGCIALSVFIGAKEIYEAYENHQDVIAKTVGVISEIGYVIAAGTAIGYLFTPAGWISLIFTAGLEGVGLAVTGKLFEIEVEKAITSIEHLTKEGVTWLKKEWNYWI